VAEDLVIGAARISTRMAAIKLVPVTEADVGWLFRYATAFPERWPRLCRRGVPSFPELRGLLWAAVSALYRVDTPIPGQPDMGRPIGVVGLYNLNQASGVVWLDRLDFPEADRDVMDQAVSRLLEIAKTVAPLRRVCVEYFDCIPSPFSGRPEVESHGRLEEHGYYMGDLCSLVFESVALS
jgi:hypothetical protein